jgi:hypothetical protein
MQAAADFRQERNELETILASGILNRAPNLAQLLNYVCAKYFEGAAEQIKEYNIAVEALGRPAEFDQKRDSIVRVEAHRLPEYYEADGADHAIESTFRPASMRPRFTVGSAAAEPDAETLVAQGDGGRAIASGGGADGAGADGSGDDGGANPVWSGADGLSHMQRGHRRLVLTVARRVALWRGPERQSTSHRHAAADRGAIAIRECGFGGSWNGDYTGRLGRIWQSDRYFQGGAF